MFILIVSECLADMGNKYNGSEALWRFSFCIANEIACLLEYSYEQIEKVIYTLRKVVSCMAGTPKSWKEN